MSKQVLPANREQAERLAELGSQLRELRQAQAIPLEQVAGKTRIQPRLLRAIEQGKLEDLPEPVYIHSFIRQYADALGLNGVQFASGFPTVEMALPKIRTSWRTLPVAQLRPMHLYLIYMVLIVGAVNGLSYFLNRSVQSSIASMEVPKPATAPSVMGPTQPSAVKKSVSPQNQKPVRVGMTLTAQSWVHVMSDGKLEFEGVLPEGTQRTWNADKQVVIRAGNAGGVMVAFNESQPKPLGPEGAVEEKAFPPEARMATAISTERNSEGIDSQASELGQVSP